MTAPENKAAPQSAARRVRLLIILLAVSAVRVGGAEPVDLDDVYCALCHFDEGDDFAAGVHYRRGLLLCNECHGALPFESEEEIAKSPETGFIGKPSREQIAQVCGECHVGPAKFLAAGAHGDCMRKKCLNN